MTQLWSIAVVPYINSRKKGEKTGGNVEEIQRHLRECSVL